MLENTQPVPHPGSFIEKELERRGWSQREFADIIGRPFQLVNEIIKGKRSITTETAVAVGAAFNDSAELWLQRESAYQVAQASVDVPSVRRRAKLYELAPIKEMERRHWIAPTSDVDSLERELKKFFDVPSIDAELRIGAVTRRSDYDEPLSPCQRAWCYRVRQIANSIVVGEYKEAALDSCVQELRKIAAYPQESHKVFPTLAKYGIRLVVVEPLPKCKVDGVAMWLDEQSPVIGLSLQYDRVDSFWFTLCHELSHIRHRDAAGLDSDLMAAVSLKVKPPMERRADEESAATLIPPAEIDSFIKRVGPLYSKQRIVQFAHRIKMHPGIIVGQLQHRHEIGYSANREMLSKVREVVTSTALTDGWGYLNEIKE